MFTPMEAFTPHLKFLGITFDNRASFTKHFEETLERWNQKFYHLRMLVNKTLRAEEDLKYRQVNCVNISITGIVFKFKTPKHITL